MDPTATLIAIAEAYEAGELEDSANHAQDLLDWLDSDGFPPAISGSKAFDKLASRAACELIIREWAEASA